MWWCLLTGSNSFSFKQWFFSFLNLTFNPLTFIVITLVVVVVIYILYFMVFCCLWLAAVLRVLRLASTHNMFCCNTIASANCLYIALLFVVVAATICCWCHWRDCYFVTVLLSFCFFDSYFLLFLKLFLYLASHSLTL